MRPSCNLEVARSRLSSIPSCPSTGPKSWSRWSLWTQWLGASCCPRSFHHLSTGWWMMSRRWSCRPVPWRFRVLLPFSPRRPRRPHNPKMRTTALRLPPLSPTRSISPTQYKGQCRGQCRGLRGRRTEPGSASAKLNATTHGRSPQKNGRRVATRRDVHARHPPEMSLASTNEGASWDRGTKKPPMYRGRYTGGRQNPRRGSADGGCLGPTPSPTPGSRDPKLGTRRRCCRATGRHLRLLQQRVRRAA